MSLPVLAEHGPRGQIRKSRSGARRALVLAAVQVLIIIHILVWKFGAFGGTTITPVEPSESMEFVKHGVINAGLIFFSLALLSTLILGRWFCGWGCHIVMLQDLCGWLMKKCGVRPKPFRSRLLIYVPLILAVYMFIWPAAYRWGFAPVGRQLAAHWDWFPHTAEVPAWPGFSSAMTTTSFWKTFPGLMVAIPFLLICGFATVYFLGAKGFCTYGCPYGGFFAPLDNYATGRIRVTDACEGCGHCTAVCTSNVRVHEEVREYGMVVDPGCMKCLDCVSVCPNEALYFGFGAPAVSKGPAKNQAPKRKYDLTVREELAMAGVFLAVFFAFRGDFIHLPLLMTAGVAGVLTFIIWKAWRLLRDANVSLNRRQLKLKRRFKPWGWGFAGLAVAVMAFAAHSGVVSAYDALGDLHDREVPRPDANSMAEIVFWSEGFTAPQAMQDSARSALAHFDRAAALGGNGLGMASNWRADLDLRRAWLHSVLQEFTQAEQLLRGRLRADGPSEAVCSSLAMVLAGQRQDQQAMDYYVTTLRAHPQYTVMLEQFAAWAIKGGAATNLINFCHERLQHDPNDLAALRIITIAFAHLDAADRVLALSARWLQLAPQSAEAHKFQAVALAQSGQMDRGIEHLRHAVDLSPADAGLRSLLADMLDAQGHSAEAAAERKAADSLLRQPRRQPAHES